MHGAQRYLPIGLSLFMSITKQTFIGPSETAHILGDAFLRWTTFEVPYHQRRLSELRCEFIGRLFEELLLRHLLTCAQKPEDKCSIPGMVLEDLLSIWSKYHFGFGLLNVFMQRDQTVIFQ